MAVFEKTMRGALGLGAAALAATILAGTAAAAELKTWKHGMVQAKSDAGIVTMANHQNFDEKFGLDLEYVQFKGDALALKALIAGELDSYEGSPGGPLLAASKGADIKIVGCYWPGLTYGIFSRPDIASPAELKGKTLAISSPGALPDLIARAVLEKNGIDPSEVKFASMGSDSDRFRAVSAGVVDAAAASTEFVRFAESQGLKLLVHAHDVAPNYLRFCTYVTSKTLAERGDEVAAYLAAQMMGVRYALAHPDESIALSKEMTKAAADDPRAADVFAEVKQYDAVDPDMPVPMEKLAWMQDLLTATGNLKQKVDLAKLVDDSARQKALELAAKSN
ncbi:ABC transporter substrate-binding protein [Propylenella binzhouense]|nr:ABC transporter substrate-binding protein [Propylenella binzhouense]